MMQQATANMRHQAIMHARVPLRWGDAGVVVSTATAAASHPGSTRPAAWAAAQWLQPQLPVPPAAMTSKILDQLVSHSACMHCMQARHPQCILTWVVHGCSNVHQGVHRRCTKLRLCGLRLRSDSGKAHILRVDGLAALALRGCIAHKASATHVRAAAHACAAAKPTCNLLNICS